MHDAMNYIQIHIFILFNKQKVKRTTSSQPNHGKQKCTWRYGVGNPGPDFRQSKTCDEIIPVNGIATISL